VPLDITGSIEDVFVDVIKTKKDSADRMVELDGDAYEALLPVLTFLDLDYRCIISIPGIDTPVSMLYGTDTEHVMTYSSIKLRPADEADTKLKALLGQTDVHTDITESLPAKTDSEMVYADAPDDDFEVIEDDDQ
jgi:hypothetical protein